MLQKLRQIISPYRQPVMLTLLLGLTTIGCQSKSPPVTTEPKPNQTNLTVDSQTIRQNQNDLNTVPTTIASPNPINTNQIEKLLREQIQKRLAKKNSPEVLPKHVAAESPPETITTPKKSESQTTTYDTTIKMPALNNPKMRNSLISLNLGQVDIIQVIQLVSETTGINFVWDETITGSISVNSPTEIRMDQIYSFLESILELKGYTAVPSGDLVKIVRRSKAVRENLQVRIGADPESIPLTDTLVTQIIPLKFADVAEVAGIIRPRLSEGAQMDVNQRTSKIIITDSSANIHHIARIIAQIDLSDSQLITEVIPLNHASAQVLSKHITQILQQRPQASPGRGNPNARSASSSLKVQANDRINSIIVTAKPKDLEKIRTLVVKLDIEKSNGFDKVHHIRLKNAAAEELAESLNQALGNLSGLVSEGILQPKVIPDPATNSLIIVATQQDYDVIEKIINELDVEQEMVLVEVKIIEVTQEGLLEIGLDWATLDRAVSNSIRGFATTNFGPRADVINSTISGLSIGAFKEIGGAVTIGAVLQALEENQGVNILSSPSVTTRNHQSALFIAGDNVPFVGQSRITEGTDPSTPTVVQTFDYRDVGISLKVTPHISQEETIIIDIDSEFTNLIEGRPGQSVDTPTTAKRSVVTSLLLKNGTTTYLSGLVRDNRTTIRSQIPLLGDIPLLGELFKWRKEQVQKTNLILSITPYIIKNNTEMARLIETKNEEIDLANDENKKNW